MDEKDGRQVAVRLRDPLLSALEQRAREEERPLAQMIRLLCRRGLAQGHQERAA